MAASSLCNFLSFLLPSSSKPKKTQTHQPQLLSLSNPSPDSLPTSSSTTTRRNRDHGLVPLTSSSNEGTNDFMSVVCPSLVHANTLFFKSAYNVQIIVDEDEPEEVLLRRFRREVMKAGVITECKRRKHFENTQDERKRRVRDAAKRNKRRSVIEPNLLGQFAQAEKRHTNQLCLERKDQRQKQEAERQLRIKETDKQHRALDKLRHSVRGLKQAHNQEAPTRSRSPISSRISARTPLSLHPQTEAPPVHLGAEGSPFSLPEDESRKVENLDCPNAVLAYSNVLLDHIQVKEYIVLQNPQTFEEMLSKVNDYIDLERLDENNRQGEPQAPNHNRPRQLNTTMVAPVYTETVNHKRDTPDDQSNRPRNVDGEKFQAYGIIKSAPRVKSGAGTDVNGSFDLLVELLLGVGDTEVDRNFGKRKGGTFGTELSRTEVGSAIVVCWVVCRVVCLRPYTDMDEALLDSNVGFESLVGFDVAFECSGSLGRLRFTAGENENKFGSVSGRPIGRSWRPQPTEKVEATKSKSADEKEDNWDLPVGGNLPY
ncbi:hypothetical protein GIB67_019865 [Kingdonia uniflora]|uniref:Uncharacterized protein n=1 Tax=Kingdonia uniflora TaxID=39325 RepID=A0A7J7MKB3_9MAGN|nr:hypothetical protein GIB67_019865 [Kingdonia uniflora]